MLRVAGAEIIYFHGIINSEFKIGGMLRGFHHNLLQ